MKLARVSRRMKRPATRSGWCHVENSARAKTIGISAASQTPTYGMKRSTAARKPQSGA